ncbi:MAG: DUF3427 domain-containing protein [Solirubrobacteraceae bacterium]
MSGTTHSSSTFRRPSGITRRRGCYRDYAINRERFHWESQSTQTPQQPRMQRWIEHQQRGGNILLFVRDTRRSELGTQPFTFLGPVTYVDHGYELGAIASIRYAGGSIPADERLLADALSFGGALGELYRADPDSVSSRSSSRSNTATFHHLATSAPPAGIQIGTTVEARDLDYDKQRTWSLVAKTAAEPASDKLSIESPVGQALLGRELGDTISVVTPGGVRRYLIEHRNRVTP